MSLWCNTHPQALVAAPARRAAATAQRVLSAARRPCTQTGSGGLCDYMKLLRLEEARLCLDTISVQQ